MDLKHQANFSIGPAICRTFTITEYSSKNTAQTQAEYNFACVEFTKLTKEVRTSEENREVGFLNLMDVSQTRKKLTDSILIETLDNLKSAYDIFLNALDEKSYNKHQVQTTPYEFVLAILSPFLLMLALALRITKVTGEIRLSKNSAHRYP